MASGRPTEESAVSSSRHAATVWWFKPDLLMLVIVYPLFLLSYLLPNEWYQENARAPGFITDSSFLVVSLGVLGFLLASYLTRRGSRVPEGGWPRAEFRQFLTSELCTFLLLGTICLTLFAYLFWFKFLLSNPESLRSMVEGEASAYAGRANLETMPGITTMTQFGVAYLIVWSYRAALLGIWKNIFLLGFTALLLILCVVRVFAVAERLALIELIIALGLVWVACRMKRSLLLLLAPVAGVVGLVFMFGFFEYFRSWIYHYSAIESDFISFVLNRISLYYTLSFNNGIGYLLNVGPNMAPIMTFQWYWRLPLFDLGIVPDLGAEASVSRLQFLWDLANPEFNTFSGLIIPYIDFGLIGGAVTLAALGAVSGRLYGSFVQGRIVGLLIYPLWMVGIFDLPRTFLWASSRHFPAYVALLGFALLAALLVGKAKEGWRGTPERAPMEDAGQRRGKPWPAPKGDPAAIARRWHGPRAATAVDEKPAR